DSAKDTGDGSVHLAWTCSAVPFQFIGWAYDMYAEDWVQRGLNNTMWFPFSPRASSGDIVLHFSGGYHVWIASQGLQGEWRECPNPWTGILYSGAPHTPQGVRAQVKEKAPDGGGPPNAPRQVELRWKPDIYGTWLYQIIVGRQGRGFVSVDGPGGDALWHFVDYGGDCYRPQAASFKEGWAGFRLAPGEYTFFIKAKGWPAPHAESAFAMASCSVAP
ncbi:MAG: hypothetical protein NTW86_00525, partial [Candidatus Sumerlaeota bacterium]|nr:hypothetical protein [Candidatus Sumerlaeota bacterium]